MSDFSSEARAYCRQHRIYFYPNDAGCEQCERDMENMEDTDEVSEIMRNCICAIIEDESMIICGHYTEKEDRTCFYCGHLEGCHND